MHGGELLLLGVVLAQAGPMRLGIEGMPGVARVEEVVCQEDGRSLFRMLISKAVENRMGHGLTQRLCGRADALASLSLHLSVGIIVTLVVKSKPIF